MNTEMIQEIIDGAVKVATKAAIGGNPVERIVWIPSQSATQDWRGCYAVKTYESLSASETAPWDR
jgi:hypothetical protein